MRSLITLALLIFTTPLFAFTSERELLFMERTLRYAVENKNDEVIEKLLPAFEERIEWLENHPDEKYVIVNVAAQRLQVIELGYKVIDEKVIVGRDGMETPSFDNTIESIVFNPVWNIPPDLAAGMLPKMQAVGGWNGYKIYVDGEIVNDINEVKPGMIYRIIQDPSEQNALGKIKFNLPNKYGVYIHDTPRKDLFDKEDRRYSAGCVRLQNADKLAAYLLNSERDAINSIADEQTTMEIPLSEPINVYIVNWKVYLDEHDVIIYH